MFWLTLVIVGIPLFLLVVDYFQEKSARERRLKNIQKRLKDKAED